MISDSDFFPQRRKDAKVKVIISELSAFAPLREIFPVLSAESA
jgi:hypothetical protein